jgi:hypothetical protein
MQVLDNRSNGAEEGTRTPTPLRVHGPEPCASANSATSAKVSAALPGSIRKLRFLFYRGLVACQTSLFRDQLRNIAFQHSRIET